MNPKALVAAALLLAAAPAMAQSVHIDYDKNYDFSKIRTYQWVQPVEDEENPLMAQRLRNAVDYQLSMKGAQKVDSDPDIFVTYHSDSKEEVSVSSTSFGYGYGPGWYWGGGVGTSTASVTTYEVGTLVIDAWDAKTKNLIWRGTASATVSPNPDKMERKINTAVEKLFKKWEKMASTAKAT